MRGVLAVATFHDAVASSTAVGVLLVLVAHDLNFNSTFSLETGPELRFVVLLFP